MKNDFLLDNSKEDIIAIERKLSSLSVHYEQEGVKMGKREIMEAYHRHNQLLKDGSDIGIAHDEGYQAGILFAVKVLDDMFKIL